MQGLTCGAAHRAVSTRAQHTVRPRKISSPKTFMSETADHYEFVPRMSEIAREAGSLLRDYFRRRVKIEYKGDADLVTEADRASEKLILERIQAQWPSHEVIGEEGARIETGGD